MVTSIIVRNEAKEMNISVSDDDLQKSADEFRILTRLISANDTQNWLKSKKMNIDDFERTIEDTVLTNMVRNRIATDAEISKTFSENIVEFETVKIGRIVVDKLDQANEIFAQLSEGEAEFCVLAHKYSVDESTRHLGGFVGDVNREALPQSLVLKVFADNAGQYIGPVEDDGKYIIVKIIEKKRTELNDAVKEVCKNIIFQDWMKKRINKYKVNLPV
ncbi:MAG: peptidylprolyl isomerase [Nitrospirae bacterium]|nr:peptidylprolyl isomerase [Nitrospirota bacterium]